MVGRIDTAMDAAYYIAIPLLAGSLLDRWWGDPSGLPHPIVAFGRLIAWGERLLNKGEHRFLKGTLWTLFCVAAAYGLSGLSLWLSGKLSVYAELLVATLCVFYGLAARTLEQEVLAVFRAVDEELETGRRQVARIVGRDTSHLSAQQVRTAALETLAENLSDGVVAPLFWYALLGVPGMLAYKMVNTLDSMIGYKNDRYRAFGCFAARLDDVANYLPARLTALLMLCVSGCLSRWRFLLAYGPKHASPNSGYPEAALAAILDCRFGGPNYYFGERVEKPYIGTADRELTAADVHRAITVNRRVEACMIGLILLLLTLIYSL